MVNLSDARSGASATLDDELEDRLMHLWHQLCDFQTLLTVASRHAFEDFELRSEDEAHLDGLNGLRRAYDSYAAVPHLTNGTRRFLADLERRLLSLEGKAEICRLAAT